MREALKALCFVPDFCAIKNMGGKVLKQNVTYDNMKRGYEFKPSTLEERREFYDKEFSVKSVRKWFRGRGLPQLCAIDAGTKTKIILNKKLSGAIFYFPFRELKKKIKEYVPEGIYYDRTRYKNPEKVLNTLNFKENIPQELAFDVDCDNLGCWNPKNLESARECLKKAYKNACVMKKELEKDFRKVRIVYSGRGFHVHVLDKKAAVLSIKERENLNKKFKKFGIDPWVSRGYIQLIRMPYSLNGIVSRKVVPIEDKDEFDERKALPKFLKN